jgi:hypothetical protein
MAAIARPESLAESLAPELTVSAGVLFWLPVEPELLKPEPVEPEPLEPVPVEPVPLEPVPVEPVLLEPVPVEPVPLNPEAFKLPFVEPAAPDPVEFEEEDPLE